MANKMWDIAGAIAIALQAGCKVYVEFKTEENLVKYVVGSEGTADEIAALIMKDGLAELKLIAH